MEHPNSSVAARANLGEAPIRAAIQSASNFAHIGATRGNVIAKPPGRRSNLHESRLQLRFAGIVGLCSRLLFMHGRGFLSRFSARELLGNDRAARMSTTDDSPDDLVKSLVDIMTTKYVERSYDQALDCAIVIRLMTNNDANPSRRAAALTFIQDCAQLLLEPETATAAEGNSSPACSFCGQQPPAVKLGAGPSVFICNQCVDTFAKLL